MANLSPLFRFPQDLSGPWIPWRRSHDKMTAVVGNFDGFHLGHQALVERARRAALGEIAIYTFDPHPTQFFSSKRGAGRIFDFEYLHEKISQAGCAAFCVEKFDLSFSILSPREFVDHLVKKLGFSAIVVGFDFRFGKNRTGDVALLQELSRELSVSCVVCEEIQLAGEKVATSRVRRMLQAGETEKAKELLGDFYEVRGVVISGAQRGRALGFPTLNLQCTVHPPLRQGVYVTQTRIGTEWMSSVTNVGVNPTFTGSEDQDVSLKVETHVLDYQGDLYGKKLRVRFLHYIREEKKFADIEQLKAQIADDILKVREGSWGR